MTSGSDWTPGPEFLPKRLGNLLSKQIDCCNPSPQNPSESLNSSFGGLDPGKCQPDMRMDMKIFLFCPDESQPVADHSH
jgi:hypothetical protein